MGNTSSGFLTRSIILLGLVLLLMGGSLYSGKELGRSIMALTRTSIEEHFGESSPTAEDNQQGLAMQVVGPRSDFGYSPDEFGSNPFPRDWADPTEEELSVVNEEPAVEIAVLDEDVVETEGEQETAEGTESDEQPLRTRGPGTIFDLGDETVYRIQVGTFKERANAENVWRRLTQAGYDAHISTYNDADVTSYRVQVGNYHSREEADAVAEELRSMNFDGWVIEVE